MNFQSIVGPPKLELSVVIPCFNESGNLLELHRRLTDVCAAVTQDYEILLVNDGSHDETWDVISRLHKIDPHVVAVNLSRNYGHQIALSAGLSHCCGDRVLIIDADLQDPPELLSQMMKIMSAGADVVYGVRTERLGESWFKRLTASLFYRLLAKVVDVQIPVDTGDFRLISRRALDVLLSMPEHNRFIRGMVSWIGFRQVPIAYQRQPRFAGETKYPLSRMLRFAADAITGFSTLPLRTATYFGFVSGFFAFASLIYTIGSWLMGNAITGWTSLMSVVLLLGAAQLLVIGIVGEYLGRLYMEAKRRPLYVVQDLLGHETNGSFSHFERTDFGRDINLVSGNPS
ncbi:glycosyltransferase (plasmid) [Neorhizobium sp. SOG26]|uniref:glycosyltransferase family 2 protein n=1 Tax=Neorhizobium sp. SOG26 TaxID=2060726 RepID=UPI000E5935AC|nr:glycosyltransferase family 2 protein [Neorhizobium sp. SOG26]AXV17701.1 glycosyltransferase [Neorhizobium sp. SOG26]